MFEDDDAGGDRKTKYREARSERGSLISPPFDLEKYQVSRSEKREGLSYLSSFRLGKIPSIEKREARGALLSLLLSTWKNTKYRESEKREGLSYLFFFRLGKIPSIEKARNERGSCISSSFDLEKYQVSRKREARGALVSLLLSTLFFNSIDLSSPSWLPYVWRE